MRKIPRPVARGSASTALQILSLECLENRIVPSAAPAITALGVNRTYVENSVALAVFSPTTTLVDSDSPSLKGGRLTVAINVNIQPTDKLEIVGSSAAGSIRVKDGVVMRGVVRVGVISGGSTGVPFAVTFDGPGATPAAAQAILRQLSFRADTDNPSLLQRSVAAYLRDDKGNVSNVVVQKISVKAVNDAPHIRALGNEVVSAGVGALTIPVIAVDPDAKSLTFTYKLLSPPTVAGTVTMIGNRVTLTPSTDIRGSVTIQVSVTDGIASDTATFRVDFNSTMLNGLQITRPILDRWLQSGGASGIGTPLAAATRSADGTVSQRFRNGTLNCMPDGEGVVTDTIFVPYTQSSPPQKTYERRPTLVVITQGASTSGYGQPYNWEGNLANNIAADLTKAGSQVHVMTMFWDSLVSNSYGLGHAAGVIWARLTEMQNTCDIIFVGHSRGAVFNHELSFLINDHPRIGTFYEVMVDPTAAIVMGDRYPNAVASAVDTAVVYDDGYAFLSPFFNGATVADSMPVPGAEYVRVSPPGVRVFDSIGSHMRVADEYATDWYKPDLARVLQANSPLTGTVRYYAEKFVDEFEKVYCPKGPNKSLGIEVKGRIEKGNAFGSVTILGVGGVNVTIGRSGVAADVGVVYTGNASVGVSDKGLLVRVNYAGVANAGVILSRDESRVDVSFPGIQVNIGGKNAGMYFGGKKVSVDIDKALPKGAFVWKKTSPDLSVRTETFEDGKRVGLQNRGVGGEYTVETWNDFGECTKEQGNSVGKSLREVRDSAGKVLERGAIESGRWVDRQYQSGVLMVENVLQGGFGSPWNKVTTWNASGAITTLSQFAGNGQLTSKAWVDDSSRWIDESWNGAGARLKQAIHFGGRESPTFQIKSWNADATLTQLYQYSSSGAVTIRSWLQPGDKWAAQAFDGFGKITQEWISYGKFGSQVSQYSSWRADGMLNKFYQYTPAGVTAVQGWLQSGDQWAEQGLDNAGKVVKEWLKYSGLRGSQTRQFVEWDSSGHNTQVTSYASNGVKEYESWRDSKGQWIETTYSNGVVIAQRFWDSGGSYLGDKVKSFSDRLAKLDPTSWKFPKSPW